jgi:hypothetical protein
MWRYQGANPVNKTYIVSDIKDFAVVVCREKNCTSLRPGVTSSLLDSIKKVQKD